jgi:hypothetical protein
MAMRRAHLVGSIPGSDAADAMRLAVEHLGGDLACLPDGETGERRNWIISMLDAFRDHPVLELAKDGDWSDYDRTPRFRVRRGERLYGAGLDLGIAAAAREALPAYRRVRAELGAAGPAVDGLAGDGPAGDGLAGPAFQVGIPGDVDLAMFTFGPSGPVRHRRPFTEALAATMHEVHALLGADVLFQIEIPVELVLLARAPRPARPGLARVLARDVAALALGAPSGARFGVHLCLGDMNHRALGRLTDAEPLTQLSNAIVARWPASRPLEYVHVPLAAADDPPVDDAGFYAPLSGLRLGGARLVAGFAHEDQELDAQRRVRGHVEAAVGRPVDVSTSCGLGRRNRPAAVAAMQRISALLPD